MNKRILFVDADPLLMDFHALVREKAAAQWKIARAENCEHALQILAAKNFGAVVSDLRTSGTNGAVLMQTVRRIYPRIARISISQLDDQRKAPDKQKITNQFLANVTTQELFATLLRIGKLDAVLSDENLKSLADRWNSTPSPRLISLQILHELNAEMPSLEAIADLVQQYPALTAKLLRTVNSAAYARKTKTTNPLEALQYLGLNLVRSIVMSGHLFHDYEHTDLKNFTATHLWGNAQRGTQITQIIMQLEQADATTTEDSGLAGLLHHIGKMMLAKNSLPQIVGQDHLRPTDTECISPEAGRKNSDACRTRESVNLFGHWGMTTPLVEAVAFQLQPVGNETHDPNPSANSYIAHPRPDGFVPRHISNKTAAPHFDFPTDINANDRFDSERTDVQKLFPHDA